MKEKIPAGRFAYPEEIAACALFLASEAAAMITGANLAIDGGYTFSDAFERDRRQHAP
jgi:NAD(P)-dependent dehydrogenase (short-subunit alcohol dehydrogenase family)